MRTLLVLALFFSGAAHAELPYLDQDFSCTHERDAERYVSDFSIDEESFGGRDLCDPKKDTKKLFNDLTLIENTEFAAEVKHPFVRGFVERGGYYEWMKGETRGVNRGHDIPYATAYNSWGYFTMQDGWAVLSTLGRVGTIIHEARHTAGYRHYRCETGPYANSSVAGCDTGYSQGGSHAVEMEYYARVVLESKNLHPVYKSMARLMALGRSNFVFNEKPMKTREALLAKAKDKFVLVDGTRTVERALPLAPEASRLKRTSFGASLVSGSKAFALDLYDGQTASAPKSDDYSYYKQFQIPRENGPGSFRAIEEYDVGNLRYLTVLDESSQVYSYNFPDGAWHRPVPAPAGTESFVTVAPTGNQGLFARTRDGSLLPFNPERRRFDGALGVKWPEGAMSYAYLGKLLVVLGEDGSVRDAVAGSSVPQLTDTYTDLVNVPLYDAFEVAP